MLMFLFALGVCSLVFLSSFPAGSQLVSYSASVPSPTPSRSNIPSLPPSGEVQFLVLRNYPQESPIPPRAVPGVDIDHLDVLKASEFAICSNQESISRCAMSPHSEMFCIVDHLAINLNEIQFSFPSRRSQPMEQIYLRQGSIELPECKDQLRLRPHFAKADIQPLLGNRDIVSALTRPIHMRRNAPVECPQWKGGVTFLMSRFVAHNMYHATHEIFSMWISAHLYGYQSLSGFQIVFLDSAEEDLHASLFYQTTGLEPVSLTSLARSDSSERIQCFETVIIGCSSRGLLSHETALSSTNTTILGRSELWLNFRTFMRESFGKISLLRPKESLTCSSQE